MIIRELTHSVAKRFRHPATWGGILGFELVWIASRWLSGVPFRQLEIWEFLVPALFLTGHLLFSAAPWQWTGDARTAAPLWRGCLQALPWNAAWVFLLLWGVQDLVRPTKPLREPQPRPQEQQPYRLLRPRTEEPRRGPEPRAEDSRPETPLRPPVEDRAVPPERHDPGELRVERVKAPPPGLPQELKLLLLNLPFSLVMGWFLAGKERAESSEEDLREKERQARALALQAQLHPHALYNVLSGITELVHEDPDAAEQAVIGLVDLLRMLTRHGNLPALPLSQERALVRRYLSIEAIRLGDRLKVQWDWPDWADAVSLPPLLLQPLVENAVKHGISPCPEGGELRISIQRVGHELLLQVANSGASWDPTTPPGTGLSNLRERLELMPQVHATLVIRKSTDRTLAEIRISNTLA